MGREKQVRIKRAGISLVIFPLLLYWTSSFVGELLFSVYYGVKHSREIAGLLESGLSMNAIITKIGNDLINHSLWIISIASIGIIFIGWIWMKNDESTIWIKKGFIFTQEELEENRLPVGFEKKNRKKSMEHCFCRDGYSYGGRIKYFFECINQYVRY